MTKTFIDRVHDEISWLQNSDNQKLLHDKFNELKTKSSQDPNFSVSIFLLLPNDKKIIFRTLSSESGIYLANSNTKNMAAGRKASELEKIIRQTVSDVSQIESTLSTLTIADHSEKFKSEQIADQSSGQSSELYQPQKKSINLTDIKIILDGYHQQKGKFRQFFSFFHPWIAIAGRSAEIYLLEKALTRLSEDMQDWRRELARYAGELKTRREKNANESCFSCCGVFARKNNKKSKKTQTDFVLDTIIDDLSPIQSW